MGGRGCHEHKGTLKSDGYTHSGGMVMAMGCVHVHTSQKYVQFIICQLYLKKAI